MRDLKDFTRREWLRNKPLDHFLIQVCNDGLQRIFRLMRPKPLERFLRDAEHLRGGNVGLVVAYQQPSVVDLLLRMATRNLTEGTLLVFDNSRETRARTEIERVCRSRGAPYLPLPPCPTRHPNRSHGMAMTWIFYNVVRAIRPRVFSFIDHDLIPFEKTALAAGLGDQPFYGSPGVTRWGWALWAGYCSFSFSAVQDLPLNFLNDFSRGLDTGGRNWSCLYSRFDRETVRFCSARNFEIFDPLDGTPRTIGALDGAWVHLGGAGYSRLFRENLAFYQRLANAADEGATLATLSRKTRVKDDDAANNASPGRSASCSRPT